MASTPNFSLPYPALGDAPNGASQIQALASAVDTVLAEQVGDLQDSISAISQPLFAVRTATQTFAATTGMQGDAVLQIPFTDPAGIYAVSGAVRYDADSVAMYRFRFVPPANSTFYYVANFRHPSQNLGMNAAGSSTSQAAGETTVTCWGAGQNSLLGVQFDGILIMGGSTGNLGYQASNTVSGGTYGFSHQIGSFMRAEKISG